MNEAVAEESPLVLEGGQWKVKAAEASDAPATTMLDLSTISGLRVTIVGAVELEMTLDTATIDP